METGPAGTDYRTHPSRSAAEVADFGWGATPLPLGLLPVELMKQTLTYQNPAIVNSRGAGVVVHFEPRQGESF